MNLKEKNIAFLKKSPLNVIQWDYDGGEELHFVEEESNSRSIYFENNNGQPVFLSCKADEMQIDQINSSLLQIIFFFGIANLFELEMTIKRAHESSLIVVVEPNASLFRYALEHCEIERYAKKGNVVFVVGGPDQIKKLMDVALSSKLMLLLKRPVFYFSNYYRNFELGLVKNFIPVIGNSIKEKMFRLGNSIHDSLLGLIQNMQNLPAVGKSPDVGQLKDAFSGIPAFVVAAGPSLDKNIQELKRIGENGIIIAVDTIAERLVSEGIIPHFIASVERIAVWEHFFENKPDYYKNSYLVAPLVVQPLLVRAFGDRVILPMRTSVRESSWLTSMLGLKEDNNIWMGASCAHIATGFAFHLGASPIVLVGQDLAYGGDDVAKTHATKTTYDTKPERAPEEVLSVPGYNGGVVKTQPTWNSFRLIYEEFIQNNTPFIINATEGGAHIGGCEQGNLLDVVEHYCTKKINVLKVIKECPKTNLNMHDIDQKMQQYCEKLEKISKKSFQQLKALHELKAKWPSVLTKEKTDHIFAIMQKTDNFFRMIPADELIYHNLQGPMVVLLQKFHSIPDDGSKESLRSNLELQIEFCEMFSDSVWLIAQVIEENFPWVKGKFEENA